MRITPEQVRVIRQGTAEFAGEQARVWLFGSRVRDDARGGEWLKALIGGLDDAIFRTAGQQVATLARKNS